MTTDIATLPAAQLAYLGMAIAAVLVFAVTLFSVHLYVLLGERRAGDRADVQPAVRPKDATVRAAHRAF
jgi:hypothetical protein